MLRSAFVFFVFSMVIIAVSNMVEGAEAGRLTLQDAIRARTEVTLLAKKVADPHGMGYEPLRRDLAKAKAQQKAASDLLMMGKYDHAVKAFTLAKVLYRKALEGSQGMDRVAESRRQAERARAMAEVAMEVEQTQSAEAELINAEGYVEAGEIEEALARYGAATKSYRALLISGESATLEETVEARTTMIFTRRLIKDLPPGNPREQDPLRPEGMPTDFRRGPGGEGPGKIKPGSLADLIDRARRIEKAAGEALQERDYAPARALFVRAGNLYQEAVARQTKIEEAVHDRIAAEKALQITAASFDTEARPVSFERGKQIYEDGVKVLADENLEEARHLFAQAIERFAMVRAEIKLTNTLAEAQMSYVRVLSGVDKETLLKSTPEAFASAQGKACEAQSESAAGHFDNALKLYQEASSALISAVSQVLTQKNQEKAAPVIERLETALQQKDPFASQDILAELEKLIPMDERMPNLRQRVAEVPCLEKEIALDLGGGQKLEMVLIRPGTFRMGSEIGPTDEKPPHEVRFEKPFYIGRYEVTQAQWEAVMGGNPSHFKDPNRPVEQITWNDAQEFLTKLDANVPESGFRLPTEAEWEYACRAGSTSDCGDNSECLNPYGWFDSNSEGQTHPVGKKKPNPWGLYDLHGNVAEWCQDWFQESFYTTPDAAGVNPVCTNTASGARVLRGGRWNENAAGCRPSRRNGDQSDRRCFDTGLRVVFLP
jgi:formylglycine-generating enzyme required for sulfatase activity